MWHDAFLLVLLVLRCPRSTQHTTLLFASPDLFPIVIRKNTTGVRMCLGGVQKFDEILLSDAMTASDLNGFDVPVFDQLVYCFSADAKDGDDFIHGERVGIIRKAGRDFVLYVHIVSFLASR